MLNEVIFLRKNLRIEIALLFPFGALDSVIALYSFYLRMLSMSMMVKILISLWNDCNEDVNDSHIEHHHHNSHLSGNRGSLSLKEPRVLDCFHRAGCCISSDLTFVSILLFLDLSRFFPPLSSFISTIIVLIIFHLPTSFRTVSLSLAPFFAFLSASLHPSIPAFLSASLFGWQCLPLNEWGQLDVKLSILYAKTHLKIFYNCLPQLMELWPHCFLLPHLIGNVAIMGWRVYKWCIIWNMANLASALSSPT